MKTPTYAEQWQKITSAYSNNKLNPQSDCACFIGNLLNGGMWSGCRTTKNYGFTQKEVDIIPRINPSEYALFFIKEQSHGLYDVLDIIKMEQNFLSIANQGLVNGIYDEDCLYQAMVSTLEVLRQIHAERGDVTAIETPLVKRKLQTV